GRVRQHARPGGVPGGEAAPGAGGRRAAGVHVSADDGHRRPRRAAAYCEAGFQGPAGTGLPWSGGGLLFGRSSPSCTGFGALPVPNLAYSTVIAHEYAHFIAWNLMEIEISVGTRPFHEGFGDSFALLAFDTE